MRTAWRLVLVAFVLASPARAADLQSVLDRARAKAGVKGAQAAVIHDGEVVWSGSSGHAWGSRSVARDTLFPLASLTKLVTATLVVKLADEGRLRIDEPVARWLPGLPNARRVTVRMLLNHTSGLAHYDDGEHEAITEAMEDPRHRWTREEVLAAVDEAISAPGARYDYNNSNYVALGGVIEEASGEGVAAVFDRVLRGPLGLRDCTFTRRPSDARRMAHGHDGEGDDTFPEDGSVPTDVWGPIWTDGGLACTAADAGLILDAVFGGRIVSKRNLDRMVRFGKDGYGLGVTDGSEDGTTWWGHEGTYGGFESHAWYDPARRLTLVALVNQDGKSGASTVWRALDEACRKEACTGR